jgi:hypothetical protein
VLDSVVRESQYEGKQRTRVALQARGDNSGGTATVHVKNLKDNMVMLAGKGVLFCGLETTYAFEA